MSLWFQLSIAVRNTNLDSLTIDSRERVGIIIRPALLKLFHSMEAE